ncbi:MAG: hypothetical protein IPO88_11590 [Nannocystis sp.]|uniref:hypothetical protein n=1 Tax=Nannocystis sp. TaxID=1962667 RepID=UPI002424AF00|nr:hypothetical protein [Nannocystis sp.]MBK9754129.1 hypothetical protein [Nannocystis sp.]
MSGPSTKHPGPEQLGPEQLGPEHPGPEQAPKHLAPEHLARLARGEHEAVAAELAAAGAPALAGQVLEQIWDFLGAHAHYLAAGRWHDLLRCALELGRPDLLDAALARLAARPRDERDAAVALLQRRARHQEAARLLAADDADPLARAREQARAGDRRGAARTLAEHGHIREALSALDPIADHDALALALAAELAWELGDAETSVRRAQAAMRALAAAGVLSEAPGPEGQVSEDRLVIPRILARGLAALGHELAAQLVLQASGARQGLGTAARDGAASAAVPGRYHVRRTLPASFAGAAYDGLDRVTQQEVEIHLLLAEVQDAGLEAASVLASVAAFARRAGAAAELGHPAIRPVLRFEAGAGLLILPHAEGPPLRSLIRPPGMPAARARALLSFLLEGLAAAHERGLCHGSLLPAQIVCDAAGRPLLGPFGADEIAGLVATRTGALEELLTITAPELRAGGRASSASDVYSAAALLVALRTGSLGGDPERLPPGELALIADALDPDPARRPEAAVLLQRLRRRVADARELTARVPEQAVPKTMSEAGALASVGVVVEAGPGWSDAELDLLFASDAARLQPVLDREGRRIVLAAWPDGCARLADDADARGLLPLLAELGPIAELLHRRLIASAWVRTPAGEWLLALDRLLPR